MFEKAIPVFRVADLEASLAYYTGPLGFHLDWQNAGYFASVSRGQSTIFLCVEDQGHFGTWIWVGVPDADALHREYLASGAAIRNPPTNYSWAYELQVRDPDGNVLRFGSDPKPDEPLGEFLDMNGRKWPTT